MQTPSGLKIKATLPEDAEKAVLLATSVAFQKYIDLGLPEKALSGPIEFVDRPDKEESNGRYTVSSNTVKIFMPQRSNVAVDLLWSIVHELAHRIWHRSLSKKQQKAFAEYFSSLGVRFDSEAIKARVAAASQDRTSGFWFWYKRNYGKDLAGFSRYLASVKYQPSETPREYAGTSYEEAWADFVTHLVLGRSRNGWLMRRSGSEIRQFLLKLLREAFAEQKHECCGTDSCAAHSKVIPSVNMRGLLFGDKPRKVVLYDTKPEKKDKDANV